MGRRREYTDEQSGAVVVLLGRGLSYREVAARMGMSLGMVQRIASTGLKDVKLDMSLSSSMGKIT
jgi:DNA-directed RNA polymerase specialized sigma24 family protein